MGLNTSCNNIKDVLSLPTVSPHQTWVTCMCKYHKNNNTNGLDTSCNNIKDVLSLPTVSSHQTWATCMCKYYKNNITNGTGHKL
jgi:hypothetical protein